MQAIFQEEVKITPDFVKTLPDARILTAIGWLETKLFFCDNLSVARRHVDGLCAEPEGHRDGECVFFVFCATTTRKTFNHFIKTQGRRLTARGITCHAYRTTQQITDSDDRTWAKIVYEVAVLVLRAGMLMPE